MMAHVSRSRSLAGVAVSRHSRPYQEMPQKYKFTEGEKVLCYHGPLLYEAKVNKIQLKDKVPQFHIHYSGWNRSWDEWVPESRIAKYNDANLLRQKELQTQHPDKRRPKKRERPKKEAEPSRRKRGRLEPQAGGTEVAHQNEVKIVLPEELKKWLVDDWDFVFRQKQLVRLPKKVTVKEILQKYISSVPENAEKVKSGQLQEVCKGIEHYFNVILGSQLLYKFERPQYAELLESHPNTPMAELYGIEHLLRLFVRLGGMLACTTMDEGSISLLLSHLHDFLGFLAASQDSLFTMEYDTAPQEYHRRIV